VASLFADVYAAAQQPEWAARYLDLGGTCGAADAMDGSSLAASPWVP
jgi:hypothetical protein